MAIEAPQGTTETDFVAPANSEAHCRGKRWRVIALLLLLLAFVYFLLLPFAVPAPELQLKVSGVSTSKVRADAPDALLSFDATVTSWKGDYIFQLLQPQMYTSPEISRIPVRLNSPYRSGIALSPTASRYIVWKQTRTYHLVGFPERALNATSATLEAKAMLFASTGPALLDDIYDAVLKLTGSPAPAKRWDYLRRVTPVKQTIELTVPLQREK
jgi:hypothetical protein